MKTYGGFFGLEISNSKNDLHSDAIALSYGRTCLSYLIDVLKPSKMYLPYYSCDSLISPVREKNINYNLYGIDGNLEIPDEMSLGSDEYLVYINYFGIKNKYIEILVQKYGKNLIIDNTHAFYEGACEVGYSFNSARKFFGVPDGGFLFGLDKGRVSLPENTNIQVDFLANRLVGKNEEAFLAYQKYENSINSNLCEMSKFTRTWLQQLDVECIKNRRIENFNYFHSNLSGINHLGVDFSGIAPFCYPLLLDKPIDISAFHKIGIFIPFYWKEVLDRSPGFEFEKNFASRLLALPIDQRQNRDDCEFILKAVHSIVGKRI